MKTFGSSRFARWVVNRKQASYPELAVVIKNEHYPKFEKNAMLIKEYLEKKEDPELIEQFDTAWDEYRTLPELEVIEGFAYGASKF